VAILSSILKWGLRSLVVAGVLVAASLLWVDFQLNRFAGARTPEVDHADFVVPARLTAITNVHVLSADGNAMYPGHTVLFDGSGIRAIGEAVDIPDDADVVDGDGKYLIPGLVDAHVHLKQSPNDLLVYVATGVTGIREMSGNADHLAWRGQIEAGRVGPRLFVASEKVESHGWLAGHFQRWTRYRINVPRPGDAAAAVASLHQRGYDAVKLGSLLDADVYREAGRVAAERGMPVVGHLPVSVTLETLWSSEQGELAHIEEIVKALDAEFGYFGNSRSEEFLAFVGQRSGDVAAKLVEHEIAVVSSLWLVESIPRQKVAPADVLAGIEWAYANPGLVEGTPLSKGWLPGNNAYELGAEAGAGEREAHVAYWTTFAKAHHILLQAMRDEGVRVMAGTDANTAGVVPGFSLHDELGSLVAAGMSPAQALRAATAAPAQQMKQKSGKLAPGYRADMLLLNANPLDAIGNTRSIDAVFLHGRHLDRPRLDAILAAVRTTHESIRDSPR
jgi:hypothetical protein